MGDRNNPIKFGPEWLRNMSRERSAGRSTNNSLNASGGSGPPQGPAPSTPTATTATSNDRNRPSPRVLLAGLRYGREEMLALYDGNAEAPAELKSIENLYQHRGKQPVALNNTFDDDLRDNLRSAPPIGGMASSDRFGIGRSAGRGGLSNESRGRGGRGSYAHRQMAGGSGRGSWLTSSPRMPGFSGSPSEEGASARPWNANNANNRSSGDQADWANKMFRNKRPGTSTNWRQPTREEGEEWRSSDTGRNRQLDKWGNNEWGNNWGERPTGERPPSWNNRRPWVGGDSQNEENLPEWVGENADCGGSFDSSGAFHGYSNDDTNIPKPPPQETTHPLTRSHTHGSFPRPKLVEEGSDEWWASEKAKKLSPKRFDASDIKFKKQTNANAGEGTSSQNSSSKTNSLSEESAPPSTPEKLEPEHTTPELPEATLTNEMFTNKNFKNRFSESFEELMKDNEIDGSEGVNFQSVLIAANNSLRQKHQYLVPADTDEAQQKIMEGYFLLNTTKYTDLDALGAEDLVDDIFGMSMEERELMRAAKARNLSSLESLSSGLSSVLAGNAKIPQNQNAQINIPKSLPNHENQLNMDGASIRPEMPPSSMQSNHPFNLPTGMLPSPRMPVGLPSPRMPNVGLPNPNIIPSRNQAPIENAGVTNSALNASLGLPIGPGPNIMPMQGMPPQMMQNMGNNMAGSLTTGMMGPSPNNMPPFSSNNGMANNLANNSLFLGPNASNQTHPPTNEMPSQPPNMFPIHGQHNTSQQTFPTNNMYMNNAPILADQWFYEDPDRNIQGPFSSKDMYNWYRAGFFTPSLMVRRACETIMRPLGTYGPVVPFAQPMDMLATFPLTSGFESRSGHDNVIKSQSSGLDVRNINKMKIAENPPPPPMENIQFGSVGLIPNQFNQPPPPPPPQRVDTLWGQPSTSNDMVWMQHPVRSEARVNHLPIFFWDQQPSAIASNALLPEEIAKEMKTEDEILAQLRATQNIPPPPPQTFPFGDKAANTTNIKQDDCFAAAINATPNLEELHKLIQKDTLAGKQAEVENTEAEQPKPEKPARSDSSSENVQKPAAPKSVEKPKTKETDKSAKNKENNNTKNKIKKNKDDKKDDVEVKTKEDEITNAEKRSQEPSPSKNKKDEKTNKKELEREKKEWIKEGFTIVKGAEKTTKDNKKKAEEARAAEEAERKRKEEEKLAAEEEKKRKQAETAKKQQEQQQRQASESVTKKAPWCSTSSTSTREPTLAEIQRLEREKKLEQMKEQQQMMQIIAQQQAAALAREQEMQAGLGWAKKKGNNNTTPGQSLAEIQAEARKQSVAAAAAAAATAAIEEAQASPPQTNSVPWGNAQNGGLTYGFWDTQPNQPGKEKAPETPKPTEIKAKKKPTQPAKKEPSPAAEFETWCTTVLASWSSKIDVPTFVGFLKDIESPYEVKDYVKCYLGETKDSGDFARQFLERRSKLLRVGMVTPSDDLCSPAMAVTPRSGTDLELKSKGKKTKKNKMLKVDARILGFSVTAAEDRINVGDIDTV